MSSYIAPIVGAASGASVGFIFDNIPGAVAGGKIGLELGRRFNVSS